MQTITVRVPMNQTERAEHAAEQARLEEQRQREARSQRNRDAGKDAPRAGGTLFVSTARGLGRRSRAGLPFSPKAVEVKVEDISELELKKRQRTGEYVINLDGAELILEDANEEHSGLLVFAHKGDVVSSAAALTDDELEQELTRRRAAKKDGAPDRITSSRKSTENEPKGVTEATPGMPPSPPATDTKRK